VTNKPGQTRARSAAATAAEEARELERHCRNIAPDLLEGRVVPVLGAGVNLCQRPHPFNWDLESPFLPSSAELAEHLAAQSAYTPDRYEPREETFDTVTPESAYDPVYDLIRVSQYVEVLKGSVDLYRALHEVFDREYEPSVVHRFLAQLAKVVPDDQPLLALTTNYDFALEYAFRRAQVAYDLVSYVTDYPRNRRGRFTHVRWEPGQTDEPEPKVITGPNRYKDVGQRPTIVKIHGAARLKGDYKRDNYVISEDDYIDYLMRPNTTSSLPVMIRERLSESHFLFLGYSLSDWNLRVILRRIWEAQWLSARSWSVRLDADEMDEIFWHQQGVITLRQPLLEYMLTLRRVCIEVFLDSFSDDDHEERQQTLSKRWMEALFEQLAEEDRQALLGDLRPGQLETFLDELEQLEELDDVRRAHIATALPESLLATVRAAAGEHSDRSAR
jgi:hypothetical protein